MLWSDDRIDAVIDVIGLSLTCDLQVIGAMRTMRDQYEAWVAELIDEKEVLSTTVLALEEGVRQTERRIAELEQLDAERLAQILGKNEVIDSLHTEYQARIAELEDR